MAVKQRPVVEDYPPLPPTDGGDTGPSTETDAAGTYQSPAPPVEGVPDIVAMNLAYPEDQARASAMPDEATVRDVVAYDPHTGQPNDPDVVDTLTQRVMDNLPAVMQRGRLVGRKFPELFTDERKGSYSPGLIENYQQHPEWFEERPAPTPETPSSAYHADSSNPPFAALRGGPAVPETATQGTGAGTSLREPFMDWLLRGGINPDIAGQYATGALTFAPPNGTHDRGIGGLAYAGDPGQIDLTGFLRANNEMEQLGIAQHEGVHRLGYGRQAKGPFVLPDFVPAAPNYEFTPAGFAPAFRQAIAEQPGFSWLLHRGRNPGLPGTAHDYTAPFDVGMTLDEVPSVLKPYFLDWQGRSLLPENTPLALAARLGRGDGAYGAAGMLNGPWEQRDPLQELTRSQLAVLNQR